LRNKKPVPAKQTNLPEMGNETEKAGRNQKRKTGARDNFLPSPIFPICEQNFSCISSEIPDKNVETPKAIANQKQTGVPAHRTHIPDRRNQNFARNCCTSRNYSTGKELRFLETTVD